VPEDRERISATLAIFPLNDDEISGLQRIQAPLAELGIMKPDEAAVVLPLHINGFRLCSDPAEIPRKCTATANEKGWCSPDVGAEDPFLVQGALQVLLVNCVFRWV
jgi:hypothetical protein